MRAKVGGEGAFAKEAFEEFARPVLSVGSAAAVAAEEDFVSLCKAVPQKVECREDGSRALVQDRSPGEELEKMWIL